MRVFIRGLGFATCLGISRDTVLEALRTGRSGIGHCPDFQVPGVPVTLAGTVPGFHFPVTDPEEWVLPEGFQVEIKHLRPSNPSSLYGLYAARQALAEAGWTEEQTRGWRTGLVCASAGSPWLLYDTLKTLDTRGVQYMHPLNIVRSIAGSLNFNLSAALGMRGGAVGFSTACASSAHAIGYATDQIRLGRWDRALVLGAEEVGTFASLPFAAMRALSTQKDPELSPRPFDRKRDGFVPCGGGTALILEGGEEAPDGSYAEICGWGESSDGFNVMAPETDGAGVGESMQRALADAKVSPSDIDYLNAHATGTVAGDVAELRAIRRVFAGSGSGPDVGSTKSLTGHGLSLAGAMEAAFCALAVRNGFVPPNIKLTDPDPEAAGVSLPTAPKDRELEWVLSNSSGFGGSNVSLVLRRV